MKVRWHEWGIALFLAVLVAAMLLWPAGSRFQNPALEIVSVEPAAEQYGLQQVAVQVRWHWHRSP